VPVYTAGSDLFQEAVLFPIRGAVRHVPCDRDREPVASSTDGLQIDFLLRIELGLSESIEPVLQPIGLSAQLHRTA